MHEETVPLSTPSTPEVKTKEKFSYWVLLIAIVLTPLFFVPSQAVPLPLAKNILLVLAIVITAIVFLVGILREGKLVLPKTHLLWSIILLPLAYLTSSLLGISRHLSLFGYNLEVGTFSSILILFSLFTFVVFIITSKNKLFKIHAGLFLSFILVSVFALIKIFSGGNLLTLNTFSGNLGNPIGSWTDYSIYFGLFAILSTLALEYLPIKRPMRFFLYGSFVVSLLMLLVINFSIAWYLVLGSSIVMLVLSQYRKMTANPENSTKSNLYQAKYTIILAVVALLFTINPNIATNKPLGSLVSGWFNIQNSEVRPSWGATLDVSKPVLKSSPVFGSGPNTFSEEWLLNKPAVINGSAFWNVAFPFGVGFLPTQLASVGIVGALLWIIFLVLFVGLGIKAIWKRIPGEMSDKYLLISSFGGALFLWVASIIYVPSLTILSLAFVLSGLFISTLVTTGIIGTRTITFSGSPKKNLLGVLVVVLVLLGTVVFGFKSFQKAISAIYFQKALIAVNSGNQNPDELRALVNKAISFSPQDLYYRALSTLSFNQAQQIINSPNAASQDQLQAFQTAYSESVSAAQRATEVNPGNYENWVGLGGLYEALVPAPLAVTGAYDNAKAAYEKAQTLNPKSPEIPLIMARLELSNKNVEEARKHIQESIALKSDYAAAYFLLARLELGANNVATAIKAAENGAILSPGNAGVYFELGLLKYTNKDYLGAAQAFAAALQVVPDYANAQYFLGLSLYELKMPQEALAQFQALQKTNPDNAEVKAIIANLQAGKAPFFPSTSSNAGPASKSNPPLESAPSR